MSKQVSPASGSRKKPRLDSQRSLGGSNRYQTDPLSIQRVLARVEALEGKCAQLETRCRTLERTLQQQQQQPQAPATEAIISSIVSHIETKFRNIETSISTKFADMDNSSRWVECLLKNQKWAYSVPTIPTSYWINQGFDEEYVESADSFLEDFETITTSMRRGTSSDSFFHLGFGERFDELDNIQLAYDDIMLVHWREFIEALGQYHWFLNRSTTGHDESTFILSDVQVPSEICYLLERSLPLNHFTRITLQNNNFGRYGISVAIKCIENNPKLVEFILSENEIETIEDVSSLCQVVNNHPALEIFSVKRSCNNSLGHDILRSIMHANCKLKCIDLPGNNISSQGTRHIADFLATNPILGELTLENNHINDEDAEAIAEALKFNTNLKCLILKGNDITNRGVDALRKVIADQTSLSLAASCNHSCQIHLTDNPDCTSINRSLNCKVNRGNKLYSIMSSQNSSLSNANSFGSNFSPIHLPTALESIQKYAQYYVEKTTLSRETHVHVPALSIVYEIMRTWDKMPVLYLASRNANAGCHSVSALDIVPCVSSD